MNKLPEDVIRHIATFLPYNERIEVNKLVTVNMRHIKKLDSETHHVYVTMQLLTKMLNNVETKKTPRQKALAITKLMRENASNRSSLALKHSRYRAVVINKCNEFLDDGYDMSFVHRKVAKGLKNTCRRLLQKIETIEASEKITSTICRAVQII